MELVRNVFLFYTFNYSAVNSESFMSCTPDLPSSCRRPYSVEVYFVYNVLQTINCIALSIFDLKHDTHYYVERSLLYAFFS